MTGTGLVTTNAADNLQIATRTAGSGNISAINGDVLQVTYTGSLLNGTVFDSTALEGGTPLTFRLDDTNGFSFLVNDKTGNSSVDQALIGGWEQGLQGAKVGETRTLIIPASLGYGSAGQGSVPANATLNFDITIDQIGYSPALGIKGNGVRIVPGVTTTNVADGTDFGALAAGTVSASHTFSLSDLSEATNASGALVDGLNITGASITGANAADFSVPASSGGTFSVVFTPSGAGVRTATINIFSNDPNHPDYSFAVSGSTAGAGSPDITGSLVSTTIPTSVIAGQALNGSFAVNVVNDGHEVLPKGQQTTIAVIAHNTQSGANTTLYTSPAESISQLKIGVGKKFALNIKNGAALAVGSYQYYALLTPVQALAESSTSNNLLTTTAAGAALTVQAAAAFYDLTGSLVSSSLVSSATGVKGKVVVSVKSAGNVVLPAGQQIQLQIIAKGVVIPAGDPGQFTLQTQMFSVSKWKVGESAKFTVSVKDLTPLGGATYEIEANIVTVPALVESNSANNLLTTTAAGNLLDLVSTNAPHLLPAVDIATTVGSATLSLVSPGVQIGLVDSPIETLNLIGTLVYPTGSNLTSVSNTTPLDGGTLTLNNGGNTTSGSGSTTILNVGVLGNLTATGPGGTSIITLPDPTSGGNGTIASNGTLVLGSSNATTGNGSSNGTITLTGNTTVGGLGILSIPPSGSTLTIQSTTLNVSVASGAITLTWGTGDVLNSLSLSSLQNFASTTITGNGHSIVLTPTASGGGTISVDGTVATYSSMSSGGGILTFDLATPTL